MTCLDDLDLYRPRVLDCPISDLTTVLSLPLRRIETGRVCEIAIAMARWYIYKFGSAQPFKGDIKWDTQILREMPSDFGIQTKQRYIRIGNLMLRHPALFTIAIAMKWTKTKMTSLFTTRGSQSLPSLLDQISKIERKPPEECITQIINKVNEMSQADDHTVFEDSLLWKGLTVKHPGKRGCFSNQMF